MSRHERRSEIARFRREMGTYLVTTVIPADTLLDDHPLLGDATLYWHAVRASRHPVCIGCKVQLGDNETIGGWLFAWSPHVQKATSTSIFCGRCFETLSDDQLEAACTRLLRQLLPRGHFEALRGAS